MFACVANLIERSLVRHGVEPVGYRMQWVNDGRVLPYRYQIAGMGYQIDHCCVPPNYRRPRPTDPVLPLQVILLRPDRMIFSSSVPTKCVVLHGRCDRCRVVFLAELDDPPEETWAGLLKKLSEKSLGI